MSDPHDILDDFPELKFPAARGAVAPLEVAEKWGVTDRHVFELIDCGELRVLNLTGVGNKTSRQCLRVPVSSYYAVTRDRLRDGWTPPHRPDPKQPDLPGIH